MNENQNNTIDSAQSGKTPEQDNQPPINPTFIGGSSASDDLEKMQVGLSASQQGLNKPLSNGFGLKLNVRRIILPLVIVLILVGVYLFLKTFALGLGTKTLTNGGTTYTFMFYKSGYKVRLSDGTFSYKYTDKAIVTIEPSSDRVITSCSEYGNGQWQTILTDTFNGVQYPVCTLDDKTYIMEFSDLNQHNLFLLTYTSPQTSKNDTTIKTIFSSVKLMH